MSKDDPASSWRVVVKDEKTRTPSTVLTNSFALAPELTAQLFRQRWRVELFFKWIKLRLRIKAFPGTGENVVKTQILSLTMFESTPRNQLLLTSPANLEVEGMPIQGALLWKAFGHY